MDSLKTEQVIEKQNKEHPILEEHRFPTENRMNMTQGQIASLHYSGPIPPLSITQAKCKFI